jgi:two-component system sensor histidine kinase KdpD
MQLAQSLGAEVTKLEGTDVAQVLLDFARQERAAMIILGLTQRSWLHRLTHGSVVNRLLEGARGMDIMIVSFDEP